MDDFIVSHRHRQDKLFLGFLAFGIICDHARAKEIAEWYSSCRAQANNHFGSDVLRSSSFATKRDLLLSLLNEIVLESAKAIKNQAFVTLGLSSGVDSRPILVVLKNNGFQVHTYTFGERGMLDFDFIQNLCERTGDKTLLFDNTQIEWNLAVYQKDIVSFHDYVLSPRVPVHSLLSNTFPTRYEFNGYLNGQLSYSASIHSQTWEQALQKFVRLNDPFRMQDLLRVENVNSLLPSRPFLSAQNLELDFQLALTYRQEQRIRPVDTRAVTYLLPYADPRWISFWLTRPIDDVIDQRLWLLVLAEQENELLYDLRLGSGLTRSQLRNFQISLVHGWAWGQPLYRRLHQKLKIRPNFPQAPLEHFDPYTTYLKNNSFRALIHEAMTRLKGRRIFSDGFLGDILHRFKQGDWRARKRINGLVTTDILIETGILSNE